MATITKEEEIKKIIDEIEKDPKMIAALIRKTAEKRYKENKENEEYKSWIKDKSDFENYVDELLKPVEHEEKEAFVLMSNMRHWACEYSKDGIIRSIRGKYFDLQPIIKNNEIRKNIRKKYEECINSLEKSE